jgi:nitrite reductase/ring-hydroxylating ferredoxin subunit
MVDTEQQSGSGTTLTTWHQQAFTTIGKWKWLSDLTERATAVVDPLYDRFRANPAVELAHGGRWVGHSLHPALSDLPIGFWAGSLVLDTLNKDAGGRGKLDASATLSAAGLATAAATAVTGVVDWSVSDGEDRKTGVFHGVLNTAAMVLHGASLAARVSGHRGTAKALGAAGFAAVGAAGFVGGHLVQGRAVMVNRVATTGEGPNRWVPAIEEAELADGSAAGVTVDGRQVALVREGGTVHAIDDVCSHAGALLSRGEVDGCLLTCPLHYSVFDVRDGQIVRGPAHHPQPVLPTRVRNGWIEVRGSLPKGRGRKKQD